tara:strand:- start:2824 stop:2937 length:114 start_codon:yes stop_codon:yes gene_type:complete
MENEPALRSGGWGEQPVGRQPPWLVLLREEKQVRQLA